MNTRTRITLNTRGTWYQLSLLPLEHPQLHVHLVAQAEADYRRYGGRAHIVATATDLENGAQLEVVRSDRPPTCPCSCHR